jgi:hypothetical protein
MMITAVLGGMLPFAAAATEFGQIKGLWDFISIEQILVLNPQTNPVSAGPQGSSTLTSDEDFAPHRPGRELSTFATRIDPCPPPTPPGGPPKLRFTERRTFLSTNGDELATFDVPPIELDGYCFGQLTNRGSTAFAEDKGARVYVYTRAFYVPNSLTGVWHISVFQLDGTRLWSKEFRPHVSGTDDYQWSILPPRSAVGNLLHHGTRTDVIRVLRTKFVAPGTIENRYTFYDLLTGAQFRDVRHTVSVPVSAP